MNKTEFLYMYFYFLEVQIWLNNLPNFKSRALEEGQKHIATDNCIVFALYNAVYEIANNIAGYSLHSCNTSSKHYDNVFEKVENNEDTMHNDPNNNGIDYKFSVSTGKQAGKRLRKNLLLHPRGDISHLIA